MLCVHDVAATRQFYARVLGMDSREERPAKMVPALRRQQGQPGLLTDVPLDEVIAHLEREGVEILDGPGDRAGAIGGIASVYFNDPDGNLVEVSNLL